MDNLGISIYLSKKWLFDAHGKYLPLLSENAFQVTAAWSFGFRPIRRHGEMRKGFHRPLGVHSGQVLAPNFFLLQVVVHSKTATKIMGKTWLLTMFYYKLL